MLHIMIDAYGSDSPKLDNLKSVYDSIVKITNVLGVKTIMPPSLIPYYYGSVKEDDGISAFVLLKGGHFTIHTFPQRECYFVDMLYDGFVGETKLLEALRTELPYAREIVHVLDRRFEIEDQMEASEIDADKDFGPHYLMHNKLPVDLSMEDIYTFLDQVPVLINMDPISRPTVITDKVLDPEIISGITVIAQSHIALHYYKAEKRFWLDIFSCSFIECEDIINTVERLLGTACDWRLISRGSKHTDKLTERGEYISRFNVWQENIR